MRRKIVVEHLVLRAEVVVEQAVRDAGLLGDVADPRAVEAVPREHAHRRAADSSLRRSVARSDKVASIIADAMQPARGRDRRRPDPLPPRPVRGARAAAPRRARRQGRAARRRLGRDGGAGLVRARSTTARRCSPGMPRASRRRRSLAEADVVLEGFRPGVFGAARRRAPRRRRSSARSPATAPPGRTRATPGTT